jgi:HEAT repeat protein
MPLLTVRDQQGCVARLFVELIANGSGLLYFDSQRMGFRPMKTNFIEAVEAAWQAACREAGEDRVKGHDVRWYVGGKVLEVLEGGSIGAAFAAALVQLLLDRPVDPDVAITAMVDPQGQLGPVEGVTLKVKEAFSAANSNGRALQSVVVYELNAGEAKQAAFETERDPERVIRTASKLADALQLSSGLMADLQSYYDALITAPEGDKEAPAPAFGGRSLARLYVMPDFLRREKEAEHDRSSMHSAKEERVTASRQPRAQEVSDLDENALFADRDATQRVPWADARREWDREGGRAVILGAPGEGKSVLTQMLGRELAQAARKHLAGGDRPACLDELPLPIVVRLNLMLRHGLPEGRAPEAALREALASTLAEQQGCSKETARYLAEHAHESRTWLILDALDEVGADPASSGAREQLFKVLREPQWRCRVLIMSRPYGYDEPGRRLNEVLFRLAPLSACQQGELVGKWFDEAGDRKAEDMAGGVHARHERIRQLLDRSPAVQGMAQNAFLLSLLCGIAEDGEVPADVTRTQLYDRAVRRILGGEQRAAQWLACLRELAWRLFRNDERNLLLPEEEVLDLLREWGPPALKAVPALPPGEETRPDQKSAVLLLEELTKKRLLVRVGARGAMMLAHRSFAEFLAARYLAWRIKGQGWKRAQVAWVEEEHRPVADLVDHKAWLPAWQEVIVFLGGLLDRPRPLIEMLADAERDDDFRHRLALASRALAERPAHARTDLEELVDRITTQHFGLWWSFHADGTLPAIPHLSAALPSLACLNGRLSGGWPLGGNVPFLGRLADLIGRVGSEVQSHAALALCDLGVAAITEPILTCLTELLRSDDGWSRLMAARVVGHLGAAALTGPILNRLAELLGDRNDLVANEAGQALCAAAPEYSLKLLGELVRDDANQNWARLAVRTPRLGAKALEPFLACLAGLLRDGSDEERRRATWVIVALGPVAATQPFLTCLAELLRNDKAGVRFAALYVVYLLGAATETGPILASLAEQLHDESHLVHSEVHQALCGLGPVAATGPILDALADLLRADKEYVRGAAYVISRLGPAGATEAILARLVALLCAKDARVRYAAAEALGGLGTAAATEPILARLAELSRDEDQHVRSSTAKALGGLGAASLVQPLLYDESEYVRSAAASAVGVHDTLAKEPILTRLAELLRDESENVRAAAALALRRKGPVAATSAVIAHLAEQLRDNDRRVRYHTATVVGGIGTAAATEAIRSRLAELLRDKDENVRSAAIAAVRDLGAAVATTEFLARLAELLRDEDKKVQAASASAVGGLGAVAATDDIVASLAALLREEQREVPSATAKAVMVHEEQRQLRSATAKAVQTLQEGKRGRRFFGVFNPNRPTAYPRACQVCELGR